jgi:hypothetical protein
MLTIMCFLNYSSAVVDYFPWCNIALVDFVFLFYFNLVSVSELNLHSVSSEGNFVVTVNDYAVLGFCSFSRI